VLAAAPAALSPSSAAPETMEPSSLRRAGELSFEPVDDICVSFHYG